MAKPSWSSVNIESGTGNMTVIVSAQAHTGRVQRSGTLTIRTTTGSPVQTKAVALIQQPKEVFITAIESVVCGALDTSVQISGTSNTSQISFEVSGVVESVTGLKINDTDATIGQPIPNDPGADATYNWTASAIVTVNQTIEERAGTVTCKGQDDTVNPAVVNITQSEGEAQLSTDKDTIALVKEGTAEQLGITSNASWVIE